MTLDPLVKFDTQFPTSGKPGKPPELKWLRLASLVVNTDYQRPVTTGGMNTIKRIMAAFSWSRFSPVIVRRVPGPVETYEIIDGQHRSRAALNCGYDLVPAMIVHCTEEEAARIFAAVNGNVTPMQPLAVYKAALAGGEQWAVECRDAARKAGCEILLYPVPKSKQKPLQTMAVQNIKRAWAQHGPQNLEATFRVLAGSRDSHLPGYLTSYLIQHWSRILASRPGWMANPGQVIEAMRMLALSLAFEEPQSAEHKIDQHIGDGRKGDALADLKIKVADALGRRLSAQMISASLRLPYAVVDRLIAEIRADTPRLEGRA